MKIIEPSAEIIEPELAGLSVCQRIDRCASVCYQRPPKPTEQEAEDFCKNSLVARGHLPALEMAVVHLAMPWACAIDFDGEKYLSVSRTTEGMRVVSGSVRAFMEAVKNEYHSVFEFLSRHLQLFFHPTEPDPEGIDATAFAGRVRFATPDEIPWQHKHVAVRVVCSRAISHQLVRHRPCSFLQESARYCRYDDGVTFIRPEWADLIRPEWAEEFDDYETWAKKYKIFKKQCYQSEAMYKLRRDMGLSPQQARGALIHDVKTELILYASLPEWLHIFKMRCAKAADPEMRIIMVPLREQFKTEYPEMWEEA